MLTLNFNPFPVLSTERLLLRNVEQKDVREVFFLRSDEKVLEYLDRPKARSMEEAYAWIQKISEIQNNNEGINWAITMKDAETLIGTICFWNITKEHYRAEIGYSLHPQWQGKGIMQEAMNEVITYGFQNMKLHSIEANVNPKNASSIRLLERNNFVKEAHFRENYYYNGKFLDSAIYSLLAPAKQVTNAS